MDEELNVDRLIASWQFQDDFAEIALKLLISGIELGARSAVICLAKSYIDSNYEAISTDDFDNAIKEGTSKASAEIEERLKNVRGS